MRYTHGLGLLTPTQAADLTHLSTATLAIYRCRGCGPKFVRGGNRRKGAKVFYHVEEIRAYMSRSLSSTQGDALTTPKASAKRGGAHE